MSWDNTYNHHNKHLTLGELDQWFIDNSTDLKTFVAGLTEAMNRVHNSFPFLTSTLKDAFAKELVLRSRDPAL